MNQRHLGALRRSTSTMLAGMAMWVGGGACTGSVVSAPSDGGADGGSCSPADCAGMPASKTAKVCPDGTSVGATVCVGQGSQCGWGFPPCPGDAGQQCPALGCLPMCPGGVLKDGNGCDTCQCAPGTDSGGACVSQRGGPCGGNTSHPCTCASGLTCTPGDGGLPFGDVGGTCQ